MAEGGPDWRQVSAFDLLDESWVENPGRPNVVVAPALHEHDINILREDTETRGGHDGTGSSISSTDTGSSQLTVDGKVTSMREENLPPIRVQKRGHSKHGGSGEVTDSDLLLRPGPSNASYREPSHKMSASEEVLTTSHEEDLKEPMPDLDRDDEEASLSPPLSSTSKSSTESEEKRGSQAETSTVLRREEDAEDYEDQFGSAREDQSMSLAMTTAAEITCIEYSNVDIGFEGKKPAWQVARMAGKDLLTKPKTKLEMMFEVPEPPIEASGSEEKPASLIDEVAERSMQADVEGADEDRVEGEIEIVGAGEHETPEEEEEEDDDAQAWEDVEQRQSVSNEREEQEAEELLAQVPQCVFTFSSPVVVKEEKLNIPATPSGSHGLLRLLPRGSQNAEIEQILNTPRSERKAGDAFKVVSRLVEQERGEREQKRLRVDQSPNKQRTDMLEEYIKESSKIDERPRDYVREAPNFMERLRNVRLPSDASSRSSVSSLIVNRRGAKAPTPETSLLRGRPSRPLAKGQSPRKILRLWSAANQVDEEIEEENREAEAAESEWQDIPDRSPEVTTRYLEEPSSLVIPTVSIDPPTQRGMGDIISIAKETGQPGMLHIGPDDVDTQDLENMANGRMTFDRAMGKWVPARESKMNRNESNDEASDPFQDMESFASQSLMVKRPHDHAPRSQSALRNEVQLSDTSASSSQLSASRTTLHKSPEGNLLSAPKTPKPPPLSHRSPTPRSILKTGHRSLLTPDGHSPIAMRQEPRSISFADNNHQVPQGRVEKVEELLRQLAELAINPDDSSENILPNQQDTPTRKINFNPAASGGVRSPWNLSMLKGRGGNDELGNASFLTNASFNVAHDRILELITDVAPWEPGWQDLKQIDLSKRRVDSLVRLKDFLPALEEAILDDNEINYLTGLPSSLRLLFISSNRLPPTVSFGHLMNLEVLDISNNHIDEALMSLSQLVHLRHLRVESNGILSLEGIEHLDKLETLNVRGNNLQAINIIRHQWPRLKDFILSHNRIVTIRGLNHLKHLRCLNLDHNRLSRIDLGVRMSHLKQLRLSGNVHLASLDIGPAFNLRTLYADDCSLEEVLNLDCLQKLDNLSLRQQNGDGNGINWPAHQTRDIKRLFLSGNAFKSINLTNRNSLGAPSMTKFYSMVYLELSACQLTSLPLDLADLVPNVRHLNADYNLFETLPNLGNLQRLKRFSVIGCRINKSRKVVESLSGCDELSLLDIRMNPCTMGLYPPIFLSTISQKGGPINKAFLPPIPNPTIGRPDLQFNKEAEKQQRDTLESSSSGPMHQSFFHKRRPAPDLSPLSRKSQDDDDQSSIISNNTLFITSDNRFSRTLPAQYRLQRLLHRGALAMACPNLTWLDGLLIDEDEVRQADEYFQGKLQAVGNNNYTSSSDSSGDTI